jgi:hypothetical protein
LGVHAATVAGRPSSTKTSSPHHLPYERPPLVQVTSPPTGGGWDRASLDKARAAGTPFFLRTAHSGLQLQGQLLPISVVNLPGCASGAPGNLGAPRAAGVDLLAFVGVPRVAGMAELEAHGLALADLPPASLAADVALLGDRLARAEVRMHARMHTGHGDDRT